MSRRPRFRFIPTLGISVSSAAARAVLGDGLGLPLLDEDVDSSYRSDARGVVDDGDVDHIVDLIVFHGEAADVTLTDGRGFAWAADGVGPLSDGAVSLDGVELEDCTAVRQQRCVRGYGGGEWTIEVEWDADSSVLEGPGWSLTATDAAGTRRTVILRFPSS